MAAGITRALFLLRVAGPAAPELASVLPALRQFMPTSCAVSSGSSASQPPAEVPKIALGHSLSDVAVAPTLSADHSRPALFLSASLLALPFTACVQASSAAPPSPPAPGQLDQGEGRLDELLRRKDYQLPSQPSGASQDATAVRWGGDLPHGRWRPSCGFWACIKPDALAVARVALRDANGRPEVPSDNVGGPTPLSDIRMCGVCYAGPVVVKLQGWLRAREAGRYQIGADLTGTFRGSPVASTCFL